MRPLVGGEEVVLPGEVAREGRTRLRPRFEKAIRNVSVTRDDHVDLRFDSESGQDLAEHFGAIAVEMVAVPART